MSAVGTEFTVAEVLEVGIGKAAPNMPPRARSGCRWQVGKIGMDRPPCLVTVQVVEVANGKPAEARNDTDPGSALPRESVNIARCLRFGLPALPGADGFLVEVGGQDIDAEFVAVSSGIARELGYNGFVLRRIRSSTRRGMLVMIFARKR